MVEWFKAAVLKTAEAQASEGSNPSLSAIFVPKNGERSRKASLHAFAFFPLAAMRQSQKLFTQKPQAFLHIFTKFRLAC